MMRPRGDLRLELVRKGTHVLVGILVVLLVHLRILDVWLLGLAGLLVAAVIAYNYTYEKELLLKR